MVQQILESAKFFQPETALTITFCVALLVSLFDKKGTMVGGLVFCGLAITALLLVKQACTAGNVTLFHNMYAVDGFSTFFKAIILGSSLLVTIFSFQSNELLTAKRHLGEYYALLVAMTLGMFLMSGSSNLIMMYLSLELTSISSYILSGFTKQAEDSSEASLKYVIYGAFSSGVMLYGISMIYGLTGSLDVYGINEALQAGTVNMIALFIAGILTLVGFGYKISAVPFHFWTPDVYEGAPITITAFLSVASKAAGFAMMIRFFTVAFLDSTAGSLTLGTWQALQGFDWNKLVAILSVLTMTLGNLVAIWQTNIKRLLAYSSIAHAGYMLMGVVVLSSDGIAAVMIYFVVYLFMNLGAFYIVMIVANKIGSESIEDYKGLGVRSPFVGIALTVFLLSLTGIPPTAGFVGKLYLFAALINAKWFWLAIVGVLNSVVSLYYYVKIFRNMFLREPAPNAGELSFSPVHIVIIMIMLLPTLIIGIYFSPLVEIAQASVTMFGVR
ncbi:MAG: NADH-quinone oxidoreductase subunit N [Bacteroidetes bacterium]|nr:MAG: NADH-quinone oxidoreductase subunit N [Bacteroidota bacterium]